MTETPANRSDLVVHAIGRAAWQAARVGPDEVLRPASLEEEGFIHLSTPAQIAGVCNALYADRTDLVLLVVDPSQLPAELVWEDCYETGQDFPHLYAALPVAAVVDVIDYSPVDHGRFAPPRLA
jgi:uncharacterized protein (DUF952 family)